MGLNTQNEIYAWANCIEDVHWIDNTPWSLENKILSPLYMPHIEFNIDRRKVRQLIHESGALLARWTTEWDRNEGEWWWTCCDATDYDISRIKNSNARRGIRNGLKNCEIRIIDKSEFSTISYELYRKALAAYKTITPLGFDEYRRIMGKRAKFEGAVFWGCFYKDQLIAYATCVKLGNVVSLGSTKSDSDYLKLFPNNALFYEITRYYLVQEKVRYVTNGMRTLLHPTKINDFLIRMGFRKVYARLNIELSHRAKIISKMNISTWGKSIHLDTFIPQAWAKLVGFDSLVKISKS